MSQMQDDSTSSKKNKTDTSQTIYHEAQGVDVPQEGETPHNATNASRPSPAPTEHKTLYGHLYQWSKAGREYLLKRLPLLLPSAILTLLGFKQLPQSIPLLDFAKEHQVASPIIGAVLVVLFVGAMIISFMPEPKPGSDSNGPKPNTSWRVRPWMIATGMSTTSFVLSSTLLIIVLIRPAWCPTTLCLAPQPLIYGPHDANLEVHFTAIQAPAYVLTQDPSHYTLRSHNLPTSDDQRSIGALRIDEQKSSFPYIVALKIQNLRSEGFSMIIEDVALVVKQIPETPNTLNVWSQPPSLLYQSGNLYSVNYGGQDVNAVLHAIYVHLPLGHVQLHPVETDSLYLQIVPRVKIATDLRFSMQITYRIANEAQEHTFTPPYVFEVVFAKASNWHSFHLEHGQLVKDQ